MIEGSEYPANSRIHQRYKDHQEKMYILIVVYAVVFSVINKLLFKVTEWIMSFENFKTSEDYEASFVRKQSCFWFVNANFGICWFVFVERNYEGAASLLLWQFIVE